MTNEEMAIRKSNIAYIKKIQRSAHAKKMGWPGAPLSHFGTLGIEPRVMSEMIADGSVVLKEHKGVARTVTHVCLP